MRKGERWTMREGKRVGEMQKERGREEKRKKMLRERDLDSLAKEIREEKKKIGK